MEVYDFRNDEDPVDITHTELKATRIGHFFTGFLLGLFVGYVALMTIGMYMGY